MRLKNTSSEIQRQSILIYRNCYKAVVSHIKNTKPGVKGQGSFYGIMLRTEIQLLAEVFENMW